MLSPAPSRAELPPLPPALLLTGNSWIGDTGAQGRWARAPDAAWELPCSAQEWGASLCTPSCSRCERGPSHLEQPQQLLEVPSPVPQCRGCLAARMCWDGSPGGDPGSPRCPQGMQHSLCGTFRNGLSDKETGQCHPPGVHVVHSSLQPRGKAPSRGEAELSLSTERGPAAAPHPYQHLRPARRPLQLHALLPAPPGSGGRDLPRQPRPPESQSTPGMSRLPGTRVEEFVTRLQLQSRPGPGRVCRVSLHVV